LVVCREQFRGQPDKRSDRTELAVPEPVIFSYACVTEQTLVTPEVKHL